MAKGSKKPPVRRSTKAERAAYELEQELYGPFEEVQGELWPCTAPGCFHTRPAFKQPV